MGNCLPNYNIYKLSIVKTWKMSCSSHTDGAKGACVCIIVIADSQYRQAWTVDQKSCYDLFLVMYFVELCEIEELIKFYEYHQRKQKC